MENQKIENEVIVEEVVETEEKTKWYKSGWFKGTLLTVGGIALGAVASTLLGGGSENDEDNLQLGDSEEELESIKLEQQDDGSFGVVDEFKEE